MIKCNSCGKIVPPKTSYFRVLYKTFCSEKCVLTSMVSEVVPESCEHCFHAISCSEESMYGTTQKWTCEKGVELFNGDSIKGCSLWEYGDPRYTSLSFVGNKEVERITPAIGYVDDEELQKLSEEFLGVCTRLHLNQNASKQRYCNTKELQKIIEKDLERKTELEKLLNLNPN